MPVLPVQYLARDQIVPVGENVGVDDYPFPYNTLNGESPEVNFGRNSSDDNTLSSVDWEFWHRRMSLPLGRCAILDHDFERYARSITIHRIGCNPCASNMYGESCIEH